MKVTRIITFGLALNVSFLTINCGDVVEEDISNLEVFIWSPGDGVELDSSSVTLWWDFVDGARDYEVRVVSPGFDSVKFVILDSITPENRIELSLNGGQYEWSVRALNAGYATKFFVRSFSVSDTIQAVNISGMEVKLLIPSASDSVDGGEINFWWEDITEADEYQLQVVTPSFTAPKELIHDTVVTKNSLQLPLITGRAYQWQVRATSGNSKTPFTQGSFFVKASVAERPVVLQSPGSGYLTTDDHIDFKWAFDDQADFFVLRISGATSFDFVTDKKEMVVAVGNNPGSYKWSVTAVAKDAGQNFLSDTLSFELVSGPPLAPSLTAPVANAVINSFPLQFTWERQLDNIVRDSIFVYDDNDHVVSGFPASAGNVSYELQNLAAGDYSWAVKSVDSKNQDSALSGRLNFTVL